MLVEFAVTNFRSIRDRQVLSLVASPSKEHDSTHVFAPEAAGVERLLRSAVIYGANAAGKSNFLRALDVMQDIVLLHNQAGQEIPITPFLLGEPTDLASTFEIVFVAESTKFEYGFVCTRNKILEEWLFASPGKRVQKWFHRKLSSDGASQYTWDYSPSFKGPKKSWAAATRDNALFLSTAIQLNADQLKPVFAWFQRKLRVVVGSGEIADSYSKQEIEKSGERIRITDLMKNADLGIEDLEIFDKAPQATFLDIVNKAVPEEMREKILGTVRKGVRTKHLTASGSEIWFDLEDESEGTQKMFACAGPFLDVLAKGRVLVIDELNNSFHPIMVKWIVDTFNNPKTNPNCAQLIFASHATSILSLEIFRRDQIWFAEKSSERSTVIYPLTDFSPRKEVSLSKGYLQGKFGAVPFLVTGGIFHG